MNDYKAIQRMVLGNLKHENIKPSETAKNINKKFLKGEITSGQAVEQIKIFYLGGRGHDEK